MESPPLVNEYLTETAAWKFKANFAGWGTLLKLLFCIPLLFDLTFGVFVALIGVRDAAASTVWWTELVTLVSVVLLCLVDLMKSTAPSFSWLARKLTMKQKTLLGVAEPVWLKAKSPIRSTATVTFANTSLCHNVSASSLRDTSASGTGSPEHRHVGALTRLNVSMPSLLGDYVDLNANPATGFNHQLESTALKRRLQRQLSDSDIAGKKSMVEGERRRPTKRRLSLTADEASSRYVKRPELAAEMAASILLEGDGSNVTLAPVDTESVYKPVPLDYHAVLSGNMFFCRSAHRISSLQAALPESKKKEQIRFCCFYDEIWNEYNVTGDQLSRWDKRLRGWLRGTVLVPLAESIKTANAKLPADSQIGSTPLTVLVNSLPQLSEKAPKLSGIIAYLTTGTDQYATVARVRALADSGYLHAYQPAEDAALMMHCFLTYMDTVLPLRATELRERSTSFTSYHFKVAKTTSERPAVTDSKQLVIYQPNAATPHYDLLLGQKRITLRERPSNLFHCLLLFMTELRKSSTALGPIRFDKNGINIDSIFDD